jgi:hypothetical protein
MFPQRQRTDTVSSVATTFIHFDDFRLEVPSHDVGLVMRQLMELRASQAPSVAHPAYARPGLIHRDSATGQFNLSPESEEPDRPFSSVMGDTLRFLNAIANSSEADGLGGDVIANVLGVRHPKGIGSRAAIINRLLMELGFNVEEVYTNPRNNLGDRTWKPGPKITHALAALLERMGSTT